MIQSLFRNIFKGIFFILLVSFLSCAGSADKASTSQGSDNGNRVKKRHHNRQRIAVRIPVAVFLVKFDGMKTIDATYTSKEVKMLFGEVNSIWSKWGITWDVASVKTVFVNRQQFTPPSRGFSKPRDFRTAMAKVIPDKPTQPQWRIYLVKQFPVNGSAVYISERRSVLYGELNKFGKRYPIILAHELGHSLGLRHVPFPHNLMYAGPDRNPELTRNLTPRQIRIVRRQAVIGPFQRRSR